MGRRLAGSALGVALAVALSAAMLPLRSHLSVATTGLVLVVPVAVGVVTGGFLAGAVSVAAGFLIYDFVFIPPYYTLTVGAAQNWVALGVYVVIMLIMAKLMANLEAARTKAQRREAEARRLFDLSQMFVEDRSTDELLQTIAAAVHNVFDVDGVALLLPSGDRLSTAASAGAPLTDDDLRHIQSDSRVPVPVGTISGSPGQVRAVALSNAGRPVGMLAIRGLPKAASDRDLLRTFANHAAMAIERSQLKEQGRRSELLEEIDRLRRALLGAVSHDLRTPLATMKVASSTLLHPDGDLSDDDARELYGLLDVQTDRLARLVTSLLDMTRYQAGVLKVDRVACAVVDLAAEAVAAVRSALGDRIVEVDVTDWLPAVDADPVLVTQVLANLVDNADRHGPPGTPITLTADRRGNRVVVAVSDKGPGVPLGARESIFESFVGFDTAGGRSGLGLSIAKAFVEAHGERIWVDDAPGGGARFSFTLPIVTS